MFATRSFQQSSAELVRVSLCIAAVQYHDTTTRTLYIVYGLFRVLQCVSFLWARAIVAVGVTSRSCYNSQKVLLVVILLCGRMEARSGGDERFAGKANQ